MPHKTSITFNATKTSHTCQKLTLISEKAIAKKIIYAELEREKRGGYEAEFCVTALRLKKCKQIKNRSSNTVQLCLMADNVGDKYCNVFYLLI